MSADLDVKVTSVRWCMFGLRIESKLRTVPVDRFCYNLWQGAVGVT